MLLRSCPATMGVVVVAVVEEEAGKRVGSKVDKLLLVREGFRMSIWTVI